MGAEVAVLGQGPSGWTDEQPQGRDRAVEPLSPCLVVVFIRWGSMAVLSCQTLFGSGLRLALAVLGVLVFCGVPC